MAFRSHPPASSVPAARSPARTLRAGLRLGLSAVAVLVVVVALLGGASIALAGEPGSDKLRSGQDVTIPADEVVGQDLYVMAGTVRVDGTIDGDLVIAGGRVEINGTVSGDLVVAAGTVDVRGSVGGDVRAAAARIVIAGIVGEDVLATAGAITREPSGHVGEDLVVPAGLLRVEGIVSGRVVSLADRGDRGLIPGIGVFGGASDMPASAADVVIAGLRHVLILAVLAGIIFAVRPRLLPGAGDAVRRAPLRSAAWGLATLTGAVMALALVVLLGGLLGVALLLTGFGGAAALELATVGVTVSGVVLATIVAAGFLADVVVGLALALSVAPDASTHRLRGFAVAMLGAILVVAATSIPLAGPLIKVGVAVLGAGGLALVFRSNRTRDLA